MDIDDELRATHAIRTVLTRYCRGVDRMDADLITSCWHEGGTCDYGVGIHVGTPPTFVEWLWPVHFAMESHSHQVTNVTEVWPPLGLTCTHRWSGPIMVSATSSKPSTST